MPEIIDAMQRLPVLRFILSFDKLGGVNTGATSIDEPTLTMLNRADVFHVWPYKPTSSPVNRWGHRKVKRRYLKVSRGRHMPRLAELLRDELRQRNLPSVNGLEDGVGRAEFRQAWRERRADIKAAGAAAWKRYEIEEKEVRNA